jgi:hypothetical protein
VPTTFFSRDFRTRRSSADKSLSREITARISGADNVLSLLLLIVIHPTKWLLCVFVL